MGLLRDTGWVPVASGAIGAAVDCSDYTQVQVIYAASGAAGCGTTSMVWSAGAGGPVPWYKNAVNYSTNPPITASITVSAPAASASVIYYFGVGMSGTNHVGDWVPQFLNVSTIAGAASWARIIVIGK